jgi:carboxymethylenebutenolidase
LAQSEKASQERDAMPAQQIRIDASDGSGAFDAYLAIPAATPAPGVIMLHEIFGVTDWIRETADMFAARGFLVAAPDMFWRMQPNFAGDFNDAAQTEQGRRYKAMLDHAKAVEDMAAVIAMLRAMPECNGKVGATGFCTGGTMAYMAATRLDVDAAAPYYGTQIHEFLDEARGISCPAIFHCGRDDDRVPADTPERIAKAVAGLADVTVHIYDGAGHAFAHIHRPDLHAPDATHRAHARTFELFDALR